MFSLLSTREQQPTLTFEDAEDATNDFENFAGKEVKDRRIIPDLPKEEDPVSHRILDDVKIIRNRLDRLKSAPQFTTTTSRPRFISFWSNGNNAIRIDPYKDHTMDTQERLHQAKLKSKFRQRNESIFVFALSGMLLQSKRGAVTKSAYPTGRPDTYMSNSKENIYRQVSQLHKICKTLKSILEFNEYDRNERAYANTGEGRAIAQRLAELFDRTLETFRVRHKVGQSFDQVIKYAEDTIYGYDGIMLVDRQVVGSSSVLKILRQGGELERQWNAALETFVQQTNTTFGTRTSSDSFSSQEDYEEEARRWNEVMQQKAQPNSEPRLISTSDFDYSILNEKLPVMLGPPEPNVPVLFRGEQADVKKEENDEHSGSFATVKKYRLPASRTFEIKIDYQEPVLWNIDEIAVKYLDISQGPTVRSEAIRRNSVRIVRELRVWSRVRHENIVPLLGLWIEYKRFRSDRVSIPCPVAPWMGGGTLQTYLDEKPELTLRDRLKIIRGIVSALSYMHNHEYAEIVHGDLKPDNLLIKDDKVYLCDFGCSHLLDDIKGLSTEPHGNPSWLAPERIRIEVDQDGRHTKPTCASDMYAFGLVFLYTVHTKVPFEGFNLTADDLRQKRKEEDLHPVSFEDNDILKEHQLLLKICWSVGPLLRIPAKLALEVVDSLLEKCEV